VGDGERFGMIGDELVEDSRVCIRVEDVDRGWTGYEVLGVRWVEDSVEESDAFSLGTTFTRTIAACKWILCGFSAEQSPFGLRIHAITGTNLFAPYFYIAHLF
jgi:hypothetical protein